MAIIDESRFDEIENLYDDDDDVCEHGVSFDEVCEDCEELEWMDDG